MGAREEILARIRRSLTDVNAKTPVEQDAPVVWKYQQPVALDGELIEVFAQRVADYKATVVRCSVSEIGKELKTAIETIGIKTMVLPEGLDGEWVKAIEQAGVKTEVDKSGHRLSANELNEIDAVVTASAVGSAETGTIVLDHTANQGRRALSLVPDVHICVIREDQVVSSVPEAVARLKPSVLARQPLTWISGPSATSDIELSRVEGVHGPRTLYVIVAK